MFKIGDKAVYPAHGVGVIESIQKRTISGRVQTFYILKILDNGMTIMIPTANVETVGLREVIEARKVPKVYEILRERKRAVLDSQTWNRRYREYMDKIRTGSVFEVAKVMRDLFLLKLEKELSFGERKMLDMARGLLVKELAVARAIAEEKIEEDLRRIFKDVKM
ncbi:MAG: CarD family transcriptional regulator [Deltaproteobacteria bacterium]|nr:CarD family transcriptional regulator [Deltaproteobacteria bacterium]MBI3078172.1 CarD family transcriptional regulator [Deltaproteobacteria bacterium]